MFTKNAQRIVFFAMLTLATGQVVSIPMDAPNLRHAAPTAVIGKPTLALFGNDAISYMLQELTYPQLVDKIKNLDDTINKLNNKIVTDDVPGLASGRVSKQTIMQDKLALRGAKNLLNFATSEKNKRDAKPVVPRPVMID